MLFENSQYLLNILIIASIKDIGYCPYELAAKQMKELMEESFNPEPIEKIHQTPTKEFSNQEWQEYCNNAVQPFIESYNKNSEQKENQIDYHVESIPTFYSNDDIITPSENPQLMQIIKPKNSMRLMLSDFPDLNSENDESDSFKDFLRLEAEIVKGSPSPTSIPGKRKDSVESEKDDSDIQNEDRTSPW